MPRGVPGSGTAGTGTTTTKTRGRRGAYGNRKLITTGLIQASAIPSLAKITDKNAHLAFDALVSTCNTMIAANVWGTMSGPEFVNLVVHNYDSALNRAS